MPVFRHTTSKFRFSQPQYRQARTATADWDSFRGGLNTLLDPTEINKNELAQATNLKLKGKGIPTPREGTVNYFLSGATGNTQGLKGYYTSGGTNEVLAVVGGIMSKKSGASYSAISGASFASGEAVAMVQLNNTIYIVDNAGPLTKYTGTTLTSFATIAVPTNVLVTNLSGVSGTRTRSWRVSALGKVGETLASSAATLSNLPDNLLDTTIRLSWTATSAASGDLTGYNVYGREYGDERLLITLPDEDTAFEDDGSLEENLFAEPPTSNTTGGPVSSKIIKFKDKLVMTDSSNPSRILWSGGGAYIENFHWSRGGGFLDISKDDGDSVVDLIEFQDKIIVFKQRSIWQVTLSADKGVVVPSLRLITASHGAAGNRATTIMENDVVFIGRNGVYILGNEPGIIADVLRTAELSVKIRPIIDAIVEKRLANMSMVYFDKRLWISYPDQDQAQNNKVIVFDRERNAWMGPYNFGVRGWEVYFDSNNNEHLLYGKTDSPNVNEVTNSVTDDEGTAFSTILRTKKESFDAWNLLKVIRDVFFRLRNVQGTITINIFAETDTGTTKTENSFSISTTQSAAGLGTDPIGTAGLGLSVNDGSTSAINEIRKWIELNSTAYSFQIEIKTTAANATYELLDVKTEAIAHGRGRLPGSLKE